MLGGQRVIPQGRFETRSPVKTTFGVGSGPFGPVCLLHHPFDEVFGLLLAQAQGAAGQWAAFSQDGLLFFQGC